MGGFNIDRLDAAQRAQVEQFAKKNHVSLEVAAGILFPSNLKFEGDQFKKEDIPKNYVAKKEETKDNSGLYVAGGLLAGAGIGFLCGGPAGALVGGVAGLLVGCTPGSMSQDLKQGGNTYNINNAVTINLPKQDPGEKIDYEKLGDIIATAIKNNTASADDIAAAIKNALKDYFNELNKTINDNGDKVDQSVKDNGKFLAEQLSTYMMLILASQVGTENAKDVADALGITEKNNPGFYKALDVLQPRIINIQTTINEINNSIKGFQVADYSTVLGEIQQAVANLDFSSGDVDMSGVEAVLGRIETTLNGLAADVSAIRETNSNIYEVIKNLPADLKQNHADTIQAIKDGTADIGDIKGFLQDIKQNTGDILVAINNLPEAFKESHKEVIEAIQAGTAKVEDIRKLVEDIKNNTGDILVAINNLPEAFKESHKEVIEAIQAGTAKAEDIRKLVEDIKNNTSLIYDVVKNLPEQFAQDHANVIAAINAGTAKAEEIRALVEAMAGDVNVIKTVVSNLPDQFVQDHQAVIEAINNGTAKAEDIRALVEAILADTNNIKIDTADIKDYTLTSKEKLAIIAGTVTNLYDDFAVYGSAVTDLLTQILNKIPAGCNCKDYTQVFAEIKILIQNIKDKINESDVQDPHHEGILDDLDSIFA